MKVELHLHTSRYSGCALNTPHEMLARCADAGYEAVYLTEHDALWAPREVDRLRRDFPPLRIFPGVELTVGVRPLLHLLVLGTDDPTYLGLSHYPPLVLEKARAEGHVTILAHPFRWEPPQKVLDPQHLPDALEHFTPNQNMPHQIRDVETAAGRFGLPTVNSGDVHALEFIDRYWIETDRAIDSPDDIRGIILQGAYRNCSGAGIL